MDLPNGKNKIVIEGIKRVNILDYVENKNDILKANIEDINFINQTNEEIAYLNILYNHIEKYSYSKNLGVKFIDKALSFDLLEDFINYTVSNIDIEPSKQMKYVNELDNAIRADNLLNDIEKDVLISELENKIDSKLSKELDDSQKEYILREKIRVIKEELGDVNDKDKEINLFKEKIDK